MHADTVYTAPYDVLVVGSGIAGCTAAISAAQAGARVVLASYGPLFSGSSFYKGTWGLGLIAPLNEADEKDLEQTILSVGCQVADPHLVHTFVHAIQSSITWLEHECHTKLRRASTSAALQRDYLPCFDHKHRRWYGLEHDALIQSFSTLFKKLGITTLPHHSLLDLIESHNCIAGALLYDHNSHMPKSIQASAVVLATGGFGGLFCPTLTQPEVLSTAHAIALKHGCSLVNAEFIQLMPTIIHPVHGVVFNEKTFKYARITNKEGQVLTQATTTTLDAHSEHGPFSCRLSDAKLDLEIAQQPSGTAFVTYTMPTQVPEFMQTYFEWLARTAQVTPQDTLEIALWPHASNGGIFIAEDGRCIGGPTGLYAAGEACGGVHGADRLGGLSSANALVFGRISGTTAALHARNIKQSPNATTSYMCAHTACCNASAHFTDNAASLHAQELIKTIRMYIQQSCVLNRSEETLAATAQKLNWLQQTAHDEAYTYDELPIHEQEQITLQEWNDCLARTNFQQNLLLEAQALVVAMRARTESRGSHYRKDFPHQLKACERIHRILLDKQGLRCIHLT